MTTPYTFQKGYPQQKYSLVPSAGINPSQRNPTTADCKDPNAGGNYLIPTIWVNTATNGAWVLTHNTGNVATWSAITDAATGNVVGPASSTDNALARFDLATGKLIQNSIGILSDLGVLTGVRPTLPAGTAVAGTAPLTLTSGVNLTVPVAGAVEYDGAQITYTNTSLSRQTIAVGPASSTDNRLARMDGTLGAIQQAIGATLSDTDVLTFPANGGNVMTAGTRKGASVFGAGGISAPIATTAVLADSAIVITRTDRIGSTTLLGNFVTITPGVSFIVTAADTNDVSNFTWAIVG